MRQTSFGNLPGVPAGLRFADEISTFKGRRQTMPTMVDGGILSLVGGWLQYW